MISLSILKNRQLGLFAAAGALLLAVILPTIVGAAQLTERSVAVSSASKSATGVSYEIKFKPSANAGAAVIEFCGNTPIIGQTCATPTDFTAVGADNGTTIEAVDENTLKVTQAMTAGVEATINLDDVTNPSVTGPFYARIVTYDTAGDLANYVSATDLGSGTVDEGSASIIITETIGVSGAVLESMTFCVSGANTIADGCVSGVTPPTLKLGQAVGSAFALTPGTVSEGSIYTQISTNSSTGAVVSLKSSTLGCGGLVRAGTPGNCDIAPAMDTDVLDNNNTAKFGVKTAAATGGTGTFQPAVGSIYTPSAFKMNWVLDDETGVTSTFGDKFLDTASLPATNKKMTLTFGASVTNETPAGLYSADLSLIATGKF